MTFRVFLFAMLGLSLGGCAYAGDRHDTPGRWEQSEYRHEQNRRDNYYRRDEGRGVIIYQPRYQPQRYYPQGYERGYERRHDPRYDPRYNARHEYRDNHLYDGRNHRDRHAGYRDLRSRGPTYYGAPPQRHFRQHERSHQNRGIELRLYSR
jgi:hypothetical protein